MTTNLIVIPVEDLEKIVSDAVTKAMSNFHRPDEALKVKDVAKILSYSENEIYIFIKQGKLRHIVTGKNSYRVPRSAIDEFLNKSHKDTEKNKSQFVNAVQRENKIRNIKKGKKIDITFPEGTVNF